MLEAAGWRVHQERSSSGAVELKAARGDEIGLWAVLWAATAEPRQLAGPIDALADERAGDMNVRAVVLCDEAPDEGERELADRRAVEIWVMPPATPR